MTITDNSLYFAKVRPEAIIPTKNDENAGYDIYACLEDDVMIYPYTTRLVPTGIATALSKDYYLQVQERGSTGKIGMKYGAGVIDSGYRGEIFIALTNTNDKSIILTDKAPEEYPNYIVYPKSKAVAQLVVHIVPKMDVKEISYDELLKFDSKRGTGALGSSYK